MEKKKKRFIVIVLAVALILMIPLIAMQFTEEVDWSLSDFIIAGVLLLGAGLEIEIVFRRVKETKKRVAIILVVAVVLILFWLELAVGIFGSPLAGS